MKTKTIKLISFGAVALTVFLLLSCIFYQQSKKIQPIQTITASELGFDISNGSCLLIAHRGLSSLKPENTLEAIKEAGKEGFKAVEIDVHETLDGVWVLMHDDNIDKMTNGRGKIKKYTYYELLNYKLDNGANIDEYSDLQIPTLEQALDLCVQYGLKTYIDVKQGSFDGLERLAKIIEEKETETGQYCAFLSCNTEYLQKMKSSSQKAELWYVVDKLTKSNIEWCKENIGYNVIFNANHRTNTDKKIIELKEAGIELGCWTVNKNDVLKRMKSVGVKEITTDCIIPK